MAGIGNYSKGKKFTLRSGNTTSFKKMGSSPMHRNFAVGDPKKKPGNTDFSYTQSPQNKEQQDLEMMKAGSRFDESGKRKKGEAKKMAKMTREWTGLDQQKYDRDARSRRRLLEEVTAKKVLIS